MAFTDNCDIFASIHEDGVNLVVQHLMRQRPSLFNYATALFHQRPDLLCVRIVAAPKVIEANNPLFDEQDPIPVLATPVDIGLDWCLQITDAQIDFHPENVIDLPSELGEIPPQRAALRLRACFGLSCPPADVIEKILPMIEVLATAEDKGRGPAPPFGTAPPPPLASDETIVLETRELTCFCLEVFGVAHFEWGTIGNDPQQWLKVRLDGLEIVDLQPTPMENIIECYVSTVLRLGVLPGVSVKMEKLIFDVTAALEEEGIEVGQQISLQPTPISAAVPFNPAIEDNQLKAFINLVVEEV
jgi:hypothetical protein